MGILLGLLTALTWGGADFLARFATRRIGTLRAMFYMQGIGFVLLTIFLPWLGGWGHLTDGSGWRPWAWGLLAGGINAFSTLALYRAFEIGKMSVVAPLSASYPALTLLLSRLSGEPLTGVRTAGIFCVLLGAIAMLAWMKPSGPDGIPLVSGFHVAPPSLDLKRPPPGPVHDEFSHGPWRASHNAA